MLINISKAVPMTYLLTGDNTWVYNVMKYIWGDTCRVFVYTCICLKEALE